MTIKKMDARAEDDGFSIGGARLNQQSRAEMKFPGKGRRDKKRLYSWHSKNWDLHSDPSDTLCT